jgi:hypothetical protein
LKQSILVIAFVLLTALPSVAQIPDAAEFNRTFTHHTATVNNVRLHYVIGGRGEPVVLLHGIAERCGHWIADERPEYLTEQVLAFFGEEK